MKRAAQRLYDMGAKAVLLKGGHSTNNADDVFYNGAFHILESPKIATSNTHGTGCTLSSAIKKAKDYVFYAILYSLKLGKGNGPTNHLFRF